MPGYDAQSGRLEAPGPELSAARAHADDVDLRDGLAGIAAIMAGAQGIEQVLREVAAFAARAIPGADGAGVSLVQTVESGIGETIWAATNDAILDIETVQYEKLREGPGITCVHSGRPTLAGSVGGDSRWPRFGGRVARLGMHSAMALPLLVGGEVIGALDAYARARDVFGEHAVELGTEFARPAAVAVYNAQVLKHARGRAERLQRALDSRAIIDQAIGILRARGGISAEEAFDRLVQLSQTDQTKLHVVAGTLVAEAVRRAQARCI